MQMKAGQCSMLLLTKQSHGWLSVRYHQLSPEHSWTDMICTFHSWRFNVYLPSARPRRSEEVYVRGLNQRRKGWIDIPVRPQGCCWRLLSNRMWTALWSQDAVPKRKAHRRVDGWAGLRNRRLVSVWRILTSSDILSFDWISVFAWKKVRFHTLICENEEKTKRDIQIVRIKPIRG